LLTASVRHFTLCGFSDFCSNRWLYPVRKVIVLNNKSLTAARVKDHSTAMICFIQKCNCLCCNVGCHVNLKMQIYNVKKFHLQANLCEVSVENKKQNHCGDIVLVEDWQFCKRPSSTISKQDLNQNVGEVLI